MNRNRTIQLVSIGAMIACLLGAALLVPPINRERKKLQLDAGQNLGESVPPQIALATAALGSFRGLLVDWMWYRANQLKEDGKYYEANTLSQWITNLQPRFPQVWSFHAWNMAYNISVATHTPDERWDWVNKGIRLLRERGIPLNPRAIRLYRELSWIFFHKVGMFSDDVHWYYKRKLAFEMQEVIGDIDQGGTTEQVIARFKAIADAPDTLAGVIEKHPQVADLARAIGEQGYNLEDKAQREQLLRQFGRILMFFFSLDARITGMVDSGRPLPPSIDPKIYNRIITNQQYAQAMPHLVAWLRKRVLLDSYHMDPKFMLEIMNEYGPVDWRHFAGHAIYWADLGTKMIGELRHSEGVDLINTYRQKVHSFQALTRHGKLVFDPFSEYLDLMPDPRFIGGYERALEQAEQAYFDKHGQHTDSYRSGHENFLLLAMRYEYLYGNMEEAQKYHRKARELYGNDPHNLMSTRYQQTLADLVFSELVSTEDMMDQARQFIDAMIRRSLEQGLANGRMDVFTRFLDMGRRMHERFQARATATVIAPQDRMKLLPWPETVESTYVTFMLESRISPLYRARVWANTPIQIQQAVYDRLVEPLSVQLRQFGLDPTRAISEPEGMAEYRKANPDKGREQRQPADAPASIERK